MAAPSKALTLLILAVVFAPALLSAQAPASGEFVAFRGSDTASVERFTRDAGSLSGEIFQRGFHVRYTARLRADQSVEHLEFDGEGNGGQSGGRLDFTPTGVRGERRVGVATIPVDIVSRHPAFPFLANSMALLEQAVRATHAATGRDATVSILRLGVAAFATDTIVLRQTRRDSMLVLAAEGDVQVALADGINITGAASRSANVRFERRPLSTASLAWLVPRPPASVEPIEAPDVHADRTVTVRVRAPAATQVSIVFQRTRRPLTRDSSGVWTTTVGPLEPDIYSYRVTIDGSDVPTPLSESAVDRNSGWGPTQFEIPGSAWTLRAVAHGTVTSVLYHSKALGGMFRAVNVYTPPGYDSSAARFPVLYLLHGAGGTESSWMISGRANLILDNLIADGAARPMIVVMPFGHLEQTKALQLPEVDAPVGRTFSDDLLGDVVPIVEQRFRVSRSADQRAIAGLSMGGAQALEIGLSHPDLFHWIAGFSSALYVPAYSSFPVQGRIASLSIADVTTMNKAIKLLWVACGRQDGLLTNSRLFVNTLEARGLHHTFVTTEGAHEWAVWRRNLADLVPQLFVAR